MIHTVVPILPFYFVVLQDLTRRRLTHPLLLFGSTNPVRVMNNLQGKEKEIVSVECRGDDDDDDDDDDDEEEEEGREREREK